MKDLIKRWRHGKQYGYEVLFKSQERKLAGKPGVILADLGMPEDYEAGFYTGFMEHVFDYALPAFLRPIVLADRGIALIDPGNPLAREPFSPARLIDMRGSYTNRDGRPYVDCTVTWRPPGMKKNPTDHGYFLYKDDGKGGAPDVCQKTGAKVAGWYFGYLLPEKKVAWAYQCGKIYEDASRILKDRFAGIEIRHARYADKSSIQKAVDELMEAGCRTLIYQSFCNPVYSDFEDYAFALPAVHEAVNGRARIICTDQPGNHPAMREAFIHLIRDRMNEVPVGARVLLILSRHGHPFKKETMDKRAHLYRIPLESGARKVMQEWGGRWELVWSDDEYADSYWDPRNRKFSTLQAYRKAIEEGYDFAIEVPTDFIAENTDLMIFHAMKKFRAFASYDPHEPIPYPDWDRPLVRIYRENGTTGIYSGCPVGPYRKFVVEAVVASVSEILGHDHRIQS